MRIPAFLEGTKKLYRIPICRIGSKVTFGPFDSSFCDSFGPIPSRYRVYIYHFYYDEIEASSENRNQFSGTKEGEIKYYRRTSIEFITRYEDSLLIFFS
mmetsp:Transcript_7225/g.15430  ORF Transcript_7225/g.15430 Transcript_7225/m.15430 type:complete len:99 (-) Transcript_7225:3078-3374(-)